MATIRQLPSDVAAKIAAGEVVERPASVVKELVENAIDAGASSIAVEVEDGGRIRISVTDDGCGMVRDDAVRSIERYATSKISSEHDLFRLATMGFRGEALHAIASVSRFIMETRTKDELEGTRLETSGGVELKVRATGCPAGTRVEVRDLFFNTPARRKFLKTVQAEFGHISQELARIAIANPFIAFELRHNGKKIWAHSQVRDEVDRMRVMVSPDEMSRLVRIYEEGEGLNVWGWIGDEMITRASPKDFHIFVNRRPVRDRLLMHGITSGYGPSLDRGRFPVAAVFVDIDPGNVDVNVHPTKREVRFENGAAMHDFLRAAVNKALGSSRSERALGSSEKGYSGVERAIMTFEERRGAAGASSTAPLDQRRSTRGQSPPLFEMSSGIRLLGQFNNAFILCEDRDGTLVVIDQHAAHERLGFEELMREYRAGKVERQQLLFPQTVTLSPQEMSQLDGARDVLEQAGFEIEPFGGNEILIKTIPAILGDVDAKPLLEKIFAELDGMGSSTALDERVRSVFSVVACHRQVRAGDTLSQVEMQRLVDDIIREKIDSCPHGRPAVVRFTRSEIDKWFKR